MLRRARACAAFPAFCAAATALSFAPAAEAQCDPAWSAAFGGAYPNGPVRALERHDDGFGLATFVGGDFTEIGESGAVHIARWDGYAWWPLGSGLNGPVYAMTVLDEDGPGPARPVLIVGGDFTEAGGVPAAGIARWDGENWSAVGTGFAGSVRALAAVQGDEGGRLYAGGANVTLHGAPAGTVMVWDGEVWDSLGIALRPDGRVLTLAWHEGVLYAGGEPLEETGTLPFVLARRLDGAWSPMPGSIGNGPDAPRVAALKSSGDTLYVGGDFLTIGALEAMGAAKWQGGAWAAVSLGGPIRARLISVWEDATPRVVRFGGFVRLGSGEVRGTLRTTNETDWWWHMTSLDGPVLAVAELGSNNSIYYGGDFRTHGGVRLRYLGSANTPAARPMGNGLSSWVYGLLATDIGYEGGESILPLGPAHRAGTINQSGLLRWNGREWSRFSQEHFLPSLTAGAVFDPTGSGPTSRRLCVASGDNTTGFLHSWTGSAWSLFHVTTGRIWRVTSATDQNGPALFVGGDNLFNSQLWSSLRRWDGQTWSAIGGRVPDLVMAITYVPENSAGAVPSGLYVGGRFNQVGNSPGALPVQNIARWDGAAWSALGEGLIAHMTSSTPVRDIIVFDDGSGPQLYVTGGFTHAGGQPASGIARWDGSAWSPVGSGLTFTTQSFAGGRALAVFDDGSGPALYVAGAFSGAGGLPANNIAKWDGQQWTALDLGVNGTVHALTVYDDDGDGPIPPALYVGGEFHEAGGEHSSFFARWGSPVPIPRSDPQDFTVRSGGTARFHASVVGGVVGGVGGAGGTLAYQWRRNGVPLADGGPYSGVTTPYLRVSPARPVLAGEYDVLVGNDCGQTTTAAAALIITCRADWDGSGLVQSNDLSAFLTDWLASISTGSLDADFNGDGRVNSSDISSFISAWLDAAQNGC